MPNRPGNDDRNVVTSQRDTSTDKARQNGSPGVTGAASPSRTRSNRGFASMDRDKQKEIASKGGRAAHAKGTAHEFDSGEAREAGRLLKEGGYVFDAAFTSVLKRAIKTLGLALDTLEPLLKSMFEAH